MTASADPTRVITRRAVALLVDALLIALLPALTVLAVGRGRLVHACPARLRGETCLVWKGNGVVVANGSIVAFLVVLACMYLLVFVLVQGRTGGSPGKVLLGIRVIDGEGGRPGVRRSLLRALAWLVDGLSVVVPVALWSAWCTRGHRRVGDHLAGTWVVRADAAGGAFRPGDPPAESG